MLKTTILSAFFAVALTISANANEHKSKGHEHKDQIEAACQKDHGTDAAKVAKCIEEKGKEHSDKK